MPDTLPVHLNREGVHSLSVPDRFEADGSFDVVLVNHGEPVHVHLHLDDALSRLATLDATNHYVDGESQRPVRIRVDASEEVRGKLKVVTNHGAETRYVDVDLTEPAPGGGGTVEVDESLSSPAPVESTDEGALAALPRPDDATLATLGLAALAIVVAVAAAAVVGGTAVTLGAVAVVLVALLGAAFVVFE